MQNGFMEAFNGRMRDELLNESLFRGLDDARAQIAAWVADYNTERPHSALGYQTPSEVHAALALTTKPATGQPAPIREVSQPGLLLTAEKPLPSTCGVQLRLDESSGAGQQPSTTQESRTCCSGSAPITSSTTTVTIFVVQAGTTM